MRQNTGSSFRKYRLRDIFNYSPSLWFRYHIALSQLDYGERSTALEVGISNVSIFSFLRRKDLIKLKPWILEINEKRVLDYRGRGAVGDITKIPFNDCSFDYTISLACIDYLDKTNIIKALKEMKRISRKKIIIETILQDKDNNLHGKDLEIKFTKNLLLRGKPSPEYTHIHENAGYTSLKELLEQDFLPKPQIITYSQYRTMLTSHNPFLKYLFRILFYVKGEGILKKGMHTHALLIYNMDKIYS